MCQCCVAALQFWQQLLLDEKSELKNEYQTPVAGHQYEEISGGKILSPDNHHTLQYDSFKGTTSQAEASVMVIENQYAEIAHQQGTCS